MVGKEGNEMANSFEENEEDFEHEVITCPLTDCDTIQKCNAVSAADDSFYVCSNCPIDWELLRVKAEKESDEKHRTIFCPLFRVKFDDVPTYKCNGTPTREKDSEPCRDCPIDWSKVRW